MKQIVKIYVAFFILILVAGCNYSDYETTPDGLRYKYLKRGQGLALPERGQVVFINYEIKNEEDSLIFSTYRDTKKADRIPFGPPTHKNGDIFSAIGMMSEGDSMAFLINADSFYMKTRLWNKLPDFIKKGSDLKFTIVLEKIMSENEYVEFENKEKYARFLKEVELMDSAMNMNSWDMVKLDNGIRYYVTEKGSGKKVNMDDRVNFHYIGKVLNTGTEFINSYMMGSAASFRAGDPTIEPECINHMIFELNEGDKATFFIPFDLGYVDKRVGNLVPPYSTLVYEVNLVKVEK